MIQNCVFNLPQTLCDQTLGRSMDVLSEAQTTLVVPGYNANQREGHGMAKVRGLRWFLIIYQFNYLVSLLGPKKILALSF